MGEELEDDDNELDTHLSKRRKVSRGLEPIVGRTVKGKDFWSCITKRLKTFLANDPKMESADSRRYVNWFAY